MDNAEISNHLMDYKAEFETVELILNSDCITKGVDAFALSLIKAERQMRKIFTFLVYQNPNFSQQYNELRGALSATRNIYFFGFVKGIEAMYPIKIEHLIGSEFKVLETNLLDAISIRNKIFHGQITPDALNTHDLTRIVELIMKWCRLLASGGNREFGYDGFGRNSLRKGEKEIYSKYLVRLSTIDEYKSFLKKYMSGKC